MLNWQTLHGKQQLEESSPIRRWCRRTIGILYVHEGQNWIRGSERCLLDLLNGLPKERFHKVVWCNADTLAEEANARNVPVILRNPWERDPGGFLPEGSLLIEAARIVREHRIRLIHANTVQTLKWLVPAGKLLGIPVVSHIHIRPTEEERRFRLMHQVTMAVGVAEESLIGLRHDGMPEERMRVILNGVNERRLLESGLGTPALEPNLGSTRPSVLFVGSLIERKGVDVLIRATSIGRDWGNGWNLLLVGDGPERESLSALTKSIGVADRVWFAGERDDIGRLFVKFPNAIYASAAREEMLPLNLIEAMTFGLPIVASDIAAHREVIGTIEGGYFPVDQPEAAAQSIASLLCDEARRQRSSAAGRERARDRFSVNRYVAEFEELYKGIVSLPRWHYSVFGGIRWPRCYNNWLRSVLSIRAKPKELRSKPSMT